MPIRIPSTATTLDGYRKWMETGTFPKRGRVTFVEGEIELDLAPNDIVSHGGVIVAVLCGLARVAEDGGKLILRGIPFVNEVAQLCTEPDLMFLPWDSFRIKRAGFRNRGRARHVFTELLGSPDLVVEVIGHSSVRRDQQFLRKKYFEAGVREYWIADCRSDESNDFQLLARGPNDFSPSRVWDDGYSDSSVLPHCFRLARRRDCVGLWQYKLESRPVASPQ